jgi:O-antigen ligase
MKWLNLAHLQTIFVGILATAIISPPLANLLELLLVVGVIFNPEARRNAVKFSATWDFKIQAAFIFLLMMGFAYPLVDMQTYFSNLLSWRKILLLPLGYVLFRDSAVQKQKALNYIFYFILTLTLMGLAYKTQLLPFFNQGVIKFQIGTTSSEGMFVAVALAIALSALLQTSHPMGLSKAMLLCCAVFLVGYVALFTTGRSGYVAILIVLLFMGGKHLKNQKEKNGLKALAVLLMVSGMSVFLLMNSKISADRINQAFTEFQLSEKNASENNVTSIGQRLNFWENTIEMIPHYFLTGAGTGGFQAAYTEQVKSKTGLQAAITQDPHNQYMKILIEQGILGLVLFLYLIARALFQPHVADTNYVLGSAVIFIWVVTSCFNAHFTTFMEGTFVWAWMGLMNRYQSSR